MAKNKDIKEACTMAEVCVSSKNSCSEQNRLDSNNECFNDGTEE